MKDYLNTEQMQALEKHAIEHYPITLEQMMQNAGEAVFDVVVEEVKPDGPILIVTGKGNNGGDALVTARLLHEKGHVGAGQSHGANKTVTILSPYPVEEFSQMAKAEMQKVMELGIPIVEDMGNGYSLIVDALFGFSLKGNPRTPADKIIEQINCSSIPVLSVDVPSGMDVHDGSIGQPTVKADYTVALGMLKKGMKSCTTGARQSHGASCAYVGKVYLGDIGIPEQAYKDKGYEPPLFRGKSNFLVSQKLGKGNRRAGQSFR